MVDASTDLLVARLVLFERSENEKKGGEKDKKERVTLIEPVAVFHAVRRRGDSSGTGAGEVLTVPVEGAAYCHMKFPAIREDTLAWARPVFNDSAVHAVDFYGSCNYDPLGPDEIKAQRRVIFDGIYGDGE